jgi:hypothetical protein
MQPIQIDAELAKKLQDAGKEVPLVGPDGATTGTFLSSERYEVLKALISELKYYQTQSPVRPFPSTGEGKKFHTMAEVIRMVEGR